MRETLWRITISSSIPSASVAPTSIALSLTTCLAVPSEDVEIAYQRRSRLAQFIILLKEAALLGEEVISV